MNFQGKTKGAALTLQIKRIERMHIQPHAHMTVQVVC